MGDLAAAPALPRGYDPNSGEQLYAYSAWDGSSDGHVWTVPGGECWLVQSMAYAVFTSAAAGQRGARTLLTDPDGFVIYAADGTETVGPNVSAVISAALDVSSTGSTMGGTDAALTCQLGPVILLPGGSASISFMTTTGAGITSADQGQIVYTRWLGSSGGGGGVLADVIPHYSPIDVEAA